MDTRRTGTARTVRTLHPARPDDIGDLRTRRPLPGPDLPQLDPFLFLNHHGPQTYPPNNGGLPFGPHPHRGFETVTFIVEGSLAHRDTGGHESVIDAGGVQWMTAGRGLVHSELSPERFLRDGGPLEILQLWVNLPAGLKMTAPRYVGLQRRDLPTLTGPDGRVRVDLVSGAWRGRRGPIESLTGVELCTVRVEAGGEADFPVASGRTPFLYVVRGRLRLGDVEAPEAHLVELNDDGERVAFGADDGALVIFGHAAPLGEPVVAQGPFVMNTHEEIREAVRDYRAGLFERGA